VLRTHTPFLNSPFDSGAQLRAKLAIFFQITKKARKPNADPTSKVVVGLLGIFSYERLRVAHSRSFTQITVRPGFLSDC
jgi:hypothetical protein